MKAARCTHLVIPAEAKPRAGTQGYTHPPLVSWAWVPDIRSANSGRTIESGRAKHRVIPGLVPGIHISACSGVCRSMDPGNKCRDDVGGR